MAGVSCTKAIVRLYGCGLSDVCRPAKITNHALLGGGTGISGRQSDVPIEPYTQETLQIRLDYEPSANIGIEAEWNGKRYVVYQAAHHSGTNRTVLSVIRPSLDACPVIEMDLLQSCQGQNADHRWSESLVAKDVRVMPWHQRTGVISSYDSRRFDEQWRLYLDHSNAELVQANMFLQYGSDRYKVVSIHDLSNRTSLPYLQAEINPFPLSNAE